MMKPLCKQLLKTTGAVRRGLTHTPACLSPSLTRSYRASGRTCFIFPSTTRQKIDTSRVHLRFFSDKNENDDNQAKVPEESDTDPQFATEQPTPTATPAETIESDEEVTEDMGEGDDESKQGRVKQWLSNLVSGDEQPEETPPEDDTDADLADKYKLALQQSQADFFNARERHKKELEQERDYAMKKFAQDMLQVVDAVDTALAQGRESAEEPHARVNTLFEGVGLIQKQLLQVFERHGVEKIECLGQEFDPNLHEAVVTMSTDEQPPDHVAQIVRDGFLIKDQILRAPMVGVSTKVPVDEGEDKN